MEVDKFSPNGQMDLNFNQKVNVPFNFIENENQTGRLLKGAISLSELDPNDLFGVVVFQKSGEDSEELGYSISINEWTEDKITMKVDFENPLAISRGLQPDQFYLKIKDTRLFVSMETGESILPENLQILSNMPT